MGDPVETGEFQDGCAAMTEHERYAKELLSNLPDDHAEMENLVFVPDQTKGRNAAKAMEAILCHRLFKKSGRQATRKRDTTYEWKEGVFNCRNIADRGYLWTNLSRRVVDRLHEFGRNKPIAYLMAYSDPSDAKLGVWSLPEPLLHESLSSLNLKKDGQGYVIQIFPRRQRIEHYAASPDLTPFFQKLSLSRQELALLRESREADELAREERQEVVPDIDGDDGDSVSENDLVELLATAAQQLTEAGVFDPSGISDARERTLSSIVRRRGQPAFRQGLLAAYKGRCAITGCCLEPVLDAAHIFPYRGPETNQLCNGLLLRTDLHTLFDLKLIAIDVATMSLLVSRSLAGTCYEEYGGKPINLPDDPRVGPSRNALEQHRTESGL